MLTHGHEDHIGATPYLLREARRHPARRLTVHPRPARVQAARAAAQRDARPCGRAAVSGSARSSASSSRSTTRSPTPSRSPSGPAPAWCSTPATSRWTSCRSTAGSPTWAASPGSATKASTSLSDSTNAEVPGFVTPEREIGPVLDTSSRRPRADHRGLVRLPRAPRAAGPRLRRQARPRSAFGRSMVRNMGIAQDLGYLHVPAAWSTRRTRRHAAAGARRPDLHGPQGEPMRALSRIAQRNHQLVHIEEGDTVILASSLIPGNENAVFKVINRPDPPGAEVVHKGDAPRSTSPGTRRRGTALPAPTWSGPAEPDARARRGASPARPRPPRHRVRGGRRPGGDLRGRQRGRPCRGPRQPGGARGRAGTSTWTACYVHLTWLQSYVLLVNW